MPETGKVVNESNPIMEIEFLNDKRILIKDTGEIIRVINDPRDIIGKTFGYIKIEDIVGVRKLDESDHTFYYRCICTGEDNGKICGKEMILSRIYFQKRKNEKDLSCGCQKYKYLETDIIGNTYNNLTVKKFDHWEYNPEPARKEKYNARDYYYICECPHHRTQIAKRDDLISYHIKGCQCTHVNHSDELPQFRQVYNSMMTRCYNPNSAHYHNYGGRGIKVCPEWHDYLTFKEDMYQSYLDSISKNGQKDTTIERYDVNKDYCKENCGWATRKEQADNKRITHYYDFNGKKYTINYFLNHMCDPGMDYEMLRSRLRSCKNMCVDDVIINGDIFKNPMYREEQKAKGLRFPINYTTNVEEFDRSKLPTTFNYMTKEEACRKD